MSSLLLYWFYLFCLFVVSLFISFFWGGAFRFYFLFLLFPLFLYFLCFLAFRFHLLFFLFPLFLYFLFLFIFFWGGAPPLFPFFSLLLSAYAFIFFVLFSFSYFSLCFLLVFLVIFLFSSSLQHISLPRPASPSVYPPIVSLPALTSSLPSSFFISHLLFVIFHLPANPYSSFSLPCVLLLLCMFFLVLLSVITLSSRF